MKTKKEKFINGHQVYLDGAWHNFCVKCGITSQHFATSCERDGEYDKAKTIFHDETAPFKKIVGQILRAKHCSCKQCAIEGTFFDVKVHINNCVFVPYREYRKDRLVERFYCGQFDLEAVGYHLIRCSITEDERNIKEVIS